jgi:hypothetical protein
MLGDGDGVVVVGVVGGSTGWGDVEVLSGAPRVVFGLLGGLVVCGSRSGAGAFGPFCPPPQATRDARSATVARTT